MSLWGGRFAGGPAPAMAALSASVHFDHRLAVHDLQASRAHARVLHRIGLLDDAELATMTEVLDGIETDVLAGAVEFLFADEDVHTALERVLIERAGPVGGKLRAGRSRNDQVATDLRLYLRVQARAVAGAVLDLADALIEQAEAHAASPAPGFTHLQHAQPVTLGHVLAAHVHALHRDLDRLRDWDVRAAVSPLGAGALAGSTLPLDPASTATDLGFDRAFANSVDAVSDRDFVAEFLFVGSLIGIHLSRLGEEWCLWSTTEFGWAKLDDAFSTGSSIMPQKKNPDIAELARGKAGRFVGNLTGLLVTLKGLPSAYNRDLQEDKEPTFDTVEQLLLLLPAVTGLVASTVFDTDRVSAGADAGFALATDIAEELVRRGVPFRTAHEVSGAWVRRCEQLGVDLPDLDDPELVRLGADAGLAPGVVDATLRDGLTVTAALAARNGPGNTAPDRVREQLAVLRTGQAERRARL
jgi:argininosuccinate lyase